ncbi:MAG: redoxin domain-containing protein [Campylobacterales bacterium]|nr:redoxin domain-containing protein [Campylobacterales bacterium]
MSKIPILMFFLSLLLGADTLLPKIDASKASTTILYFYTPWCPACVQATQILNQAEKQRLKNVKIIGICLDAKTTSTQKADAPVFETLTLSINEDKAYGITDHIPVIYILDENKRVIKQYHEVPRKDIFLELVERLSKGYLANGTLPIDKRVDLWKLDRQ